MWGADSLGNTAKLGSIDILKCLQAGLQGCILKIGLKKKAILKKWWWWGVTSYVLERSLGFII